MWRGVRAFGACFAIALVWPPFGWASADVVACVGLSLTVWVLWLLWGLAARGLGITRGGSLWRLGLVVWLLNLGK